MAHSVEHELAIKGLFQEIDCPSFHGSYRKRHVAMACDDDHRESDSASVQLFLQLKTVHVWHADVDNQARRLRNIRLCEQFFGAIKIAYRIARGLQQRAERFSNIAIIVDNKNRQAGHYPPQSRLVDGRVT